MSSRLQLLLAQEVTKKQEISVSPPSLGCCHGDEGQASMMPKGEQGPITITYKVQERALPKSVGRFGSIKDPVRLEGPGDVARVSITNILVSKEAVTMLNRTGLNLPAPEAEPEAQAEAHFNSVSTKLPQNQVPQHQRQHLRSSPDPETPPNLASCRAHALRR